MATEPVYTEGVCGDGAAILRDGVPVKITEILAMLNTHSILPQMVAVVRLPSWEQCDHKPEEERTELERFIRDNEPVRHDNEWRSALAAVLAEAINEDRWSRLPEAVDIMPPASKSADACHHINVALAELRYIRDPSLAGVVANIAQRLVLALDDLQPIPSSGSRSPSAFHTRDPGRGRLRAGAQGE